ncbi:MAG: MBL fold metallo-hydrolase [Kiritimatiellae bacterium]|nr:MBL fold metallo-hydrolase [Kiritimatiellia bacterium]
MGGLILIISTRGMIRRCVCVLIVLGLASGMVQHIIDDDTSVDVLDVGRGQASFLNVLGSGDVLVDAGPRFTAWKVLRHLRRQGVDQLHALVLTHPGSQHYGGAFKLLEAMPIKELWCPSFKGRSKTYRALLEKAKKYGLEIRTFHAGDRVELGGDIACEFLYPHKGRDYKKADDASLAIRVAREGGSILIMGGAGETVELDILEHRIEPAASVLVVGNNPNTCSETWINMVMPTYAVINKGLIPEGLKERDIPIWRIDRQGSVRVECIRSRSRGSIRSGVRIIQLDKD